MFQESFFIIDDDRSLFFFDNLTSRVRYEITVPETLTDIALSPSGDFYGISASRLYEIDLGSGNTAFIADLETPASNALEIDEAGIAYLGSAFVPGLFTLDLSNGETELVVEGDFSSAGDILDIGDTLIMSTIDRRVVEIDPVAGRVVTSVDHDLSQLYGFSFVEDDIVAYSQSDAFTFDLDDGSTSSLRSFGDVGVSVVNGAATSRAFDDSNTIGDFDARTIAYLYEAALNRDGDIDLSGLNFWIDAREDGLNERQISQLFLESDEFKTKFGTNGTLSDVQIVERLYENVLDRRGEQAGVDFWAGTLGRDDFDRSDLLLAFARSPENLVESPNIETLVEIAPGFWNFDLA